MGDHLFIMSEGVMNVAQHRWLAKDIEKEYLEKKNFCDTATAIVI